MGKDGGLVVTGRFLEVEDRPVVFVSRKDCNDRQMRSLNSMYDRANQALDGDKQKSLSENIQLASVKIGNESDEVFLDGFIIGLSHLKSHGQSLVIEYINEYKNRPSMNHGWFNLRFDDDGVLQGWSTHFKEQLVKSTTMPLLKEFH